MGQCKLVEHGSVADSRTTLWDDHESVSFCCRDRLVTARLLWLTLSLSTRDTGHSRSMLQTTDQPLLSQSAFRTRSTPDQDWDPREDRQLSSSMRSTEPAEVVTRYVTTVEVGSGR